MLKAEQVPPGLALIARRTFHDATGPTTDDDWDAAIAAAINAWPGMDISEKITRDKKSGEWRIPVPVLRLPLPKEPEA